LATQTSTVQRIALTDPDDQGKWFDRSQAEVFEEATYWNGSNHISKATGSQWNHEALYRTTNGIWVLHSFSNYENVADEYSSISAKDAAAWLIQNEHDIPDELADITAGMEV